MEPVDNQNENILPSAHEQTPLRTRKPLSLFKKMVIIVFCVVSSFGVYDLLFPSKPPAISNTNQQTTTTKKNAPQTTDWKTYTNKKYHYAIDYPSAWEYREFPDTQTGAAFRLASKPNNLCCEIITIDYSSKIGNSQDLLFEKYVAEAGQSIQGFGAIQSSKKIVTNSGVVGYVTTWHVQSLKGEKTISSPFTFFPVKDDTAGIITVTVVTPQDPVEITAYDKMLQTFRY